VMLGIPCSSLANCCLHDSYEPRYVPDLCRECAWDCRALPLVCLFACLQHSCLGLRDLERLQGFIVGVTSSYTCIYKGAHYDSYELRARIQNNLGLVGFGGGLGGSSVGWSRTPVAWLAAW
jgi:membrane-associated PAP2 superfamily phosphatase